MSADVRRQDRRVGLIPFAVFLVLSPMSVTLIILW